MQYRLSGVRKLPSVALWLAVIQFLACGKDAGSELRRDTEEDLAGDVLSDDLAQDDEVPSDVVGHDPPAAGDLVEDRHPVDPTEDLETDVETTDDGGQSEDGDGLVGSDQEGETDLVAPPQRPDLVPLEADEIVFDEQFFHSSDCALRDRCIAEPGIRRLLRFATRTANLGEGPLQMGDPEADQGFLYNSCHNYMIVEDYLTEFELRDEEDNIVARGRKESFCMADSERHIDEPDVQLLPTFSCYNQGITVGWMDHYANDLPCQWVDITDLPAGDYELVIRSNPNRLFDELDYHNNTSRVGVTIPNVELDAACSARNLIGPTRNCEWQSTAPRVCEAGSEVQVGCGSVSDCDFGLSCTGQPMLRVCDGEGTHCSWSASVASIEDGCCAAAVFSCPASGSYTVWTASHDPDQDASCDLELR